MVKNIADKVRFFCINNHKEPIEMVVKEGHSMFYACPKYMMQDEKHPDGYKRGEELACANQLSFIDASNVIFAFDKIVGESILNNEIQDYKNYEFDYKQIHVKVLSYSDDRLDLGIVNRRTVKR